MQSTAEERRKALNEISAVLKRELNEAQLETLRGLEQFGWSLAFVRHKLFEPSVVVITDGDSHGKVVAQLESDGSIKETPGLDIRHPQS